MNSAYEALVDCAEAIAREWDDFDDSVDAFPSVVLRHTEAVDLSHFGQLSNLCELLRDPRVAELQRTSTFSDLHFMLYDNGRFWIEVLNWWGSDINIHDHDFSGVQFQLNGRSLNVKYKFLEDETSGGMSMGRVDVATADIWDSGRRDQSLVLPGDLEPHRVNHLDDPTVSLLFRTHPIPALPAQNNYFPPGVRSCYGIADIQFRTRLKMLRRLARGDQTSFEDIFFGIVKEQSAGQNLFTLIKMVDLLFVPRFAALLEKFQASDLDRAPDIVRVATYHSASEYLTKVLRKTPGLSDEDRLGIAMCASAHNQPSLDAIVEAVARRGGECDVRGSLSRAVALRTPQHRSEVDRILRLYDLDADLAA